MPAEWKIIWVNEGSISREMAQICQSLDGAISEACSIRQWHEVRRIEGPAGQLMTSDEIEKECLARLDKS